MSDRINQLQTRFNELGSELLQTELAIVRFKEALTKSNDRRNTLMQNLINIDDEFQGLRRAAEAANQSSQVIAKEDGTKEVKFKEVVNEASPTVNAQSAP